MAEQHYWRNASNQLTFGMFNAAADDYRDICVTVARKFGLVEHTAPISDGLAIVFQDYRLGDKIMGMEWDNWTGFTVVAKTPISEHLDQEIGAWLLASDWGRTSN